MISAPTATATRRMVAAAIDRRAQRCDGVVDDGERCDDGNEADDDDCPNDCDVDP